MKQWTAWVAGLLISASSVALLFIGMGFRINTSDSIPIGLYRITATQNLKHAFVIFCPDARAAFQQGRERGYINSGLCPGGYGYVMKKVVANAGDRVSITAEGVFVNQTLLPFSKPKAVDGMHRPLPQWRTRDYPLKANEILTMTNQSEWSFDGRYYGPVPTGQIKGVLTPVWVNAKQEKKV